MFFSNHKKLKKSIFALFLIGVFCFSFTDFTFAKTEQEWLSEINQLLTDTDSSVVKDKEEWLSELEQVAKEETEKRVVEIECLKNPETCPIALESLAIDEYGNIEGVEDSDLYPEKTSLFGDFTQKLKQAFSSLGIAIENGVAKVRELVAEKITATQRIIAPIGQFEKIEMRDGITGEIYCTWIENGEWIKIKSVCEDLNEEEEEEEEIRKLKNDDFTQDPEMAKDPASQHQETMELTEENREGLNEEKNKIKENEKENEKEINSEDSKENRCQEKVE